MSDPRCHHCGEVTRDGEPDGSLCIRCAMALAFEYRLLVADAKRALQAAQDILDAEQVAHEAQERPRVP